MKRADEDAILRAITAAIERLPEATAERPFPAKDVVMAIDVRDRNLDVAAAAAAMVEKHWPLLHEVATRLGYRAIYLVGPTPEQVAPIYGRA